MSLNMSFQRRIIFWVLLCLFIGSTAFYLTWVPYRPTDLYRAIPAQAILVSSHQDLAGRWPGLATNLILKAFINPSDATPDQHRSLAASRPAQQWISRLARKESVMAYVPALGPNGEPAWVFTSWIGSASHYLRWALRFQRIPGLDRLGNYCNGRPIWIFRQPLTLSGARVSVAFGEGLFLATLSRNPNAMRHIIMAYDGLAPSIASSPSYHPDIRPFGRTGAPESGKTSQVPIRSATAMDQGWVRFLQPGRKLSNTLTISYTIARLNADYLSAEIRIQPEFKPRPALADTMDIPAFGQLLGDLPALVAMLPLDIMRDLLGPSISPGLHVVRQALRSNAFSAPDNSLVVTLLTGDYGGGFGKEPLRIKTPTLMAFLKLRNPDNAKYLITEVLDNLNAHYRLGLIIDPSAIPAGKMTVHTVEATQPNLLSSLANEDRPAYAVVGPWIIFSSNAQSLVKLLTRHQESETPQDIPQGRWQAQLDQNKACAFLWMDLAVCGRVLQLPLTALAISRRGDPSASSSDSRPTIKTVKTWLEDVRSLKTGVLWMESGTPAPTLRLEIGERSPAIVKSD